MILHPRQISCADCLVINNNKETTAGASSIQATHVHLAISQMMSLLRGLDLYKHASLWLHQWHN